MRAGGEGASLAIQLGPVTAVHANVQKIVISETDQNRLRDAFHVSPAAVLGATKVCKTANTLQSSTHKYMRAGGEGASLAIQLGSATAAHAKVQKTVMLETGKNRLRDAFHVSQAAVLGATKVCKTAEATSQQCATEVQQAMQPYNSAVSKRDAGQATWRRAHEDVSHKTRLHTPLHDAYTKMKRQEILEKTQPLKPPEPRPAKTRKQPEANQQSEVSSEGRRKTETTQRATDTPQVTAASTLMMLLQDTSLDSPTSTTWNIIPRT